MKKRILVISFRLLWPSHKGGYIARVLNLCRYLKRDYEIDLLTLIENKEDIKHINELKNNFDRIITFNHPKCNEYFNVGKGSFNDKPLQVNYYFVKGMQNWLKENYKNYDLLYFNTIRTAEYAKGLNVPKILDLVDAISLNYTLAKKNANLFWKLIYGIEVPRTLKYEMELLKKKYFDLYFITSPFDKRYLEEKIGSKINNLIVLPIGVNENLLKRKGTKKEEDWISFFGKMNYKPNEDAVIYFSNKIFPRIKRSLPTVRFYIVGTDPSQKVKNLEKIKDIKVTGFLEDPYSLLEKSKLIAVPLRFGAGMQTKVLESMALGKPVVSSYIGARAILAKEKGIEIITDDNPELWSKKIIDLFNNPKKRSEIGKIGKKIIINNYRWEIIGKKLLSEIKRIIN